MIEKMKFINISGPLKDIDRVTDLYLSRYEIHLEPAITALKTMDNLRPFVEQNPYLEPLQNAQRFVSCIPDAENITPAVPPGLDAMLDLISTTGERFRELTEQEEQLRTQMNDLIEKRQLIIPFRPLDCTLHDVLNYQFIVCRFGRISMESYYRLQKYLLSDLHTVFLEGERDENYVYGVYFAARSEVKKVDASFRSFHFEQIALPDSYEGTPAEAYLALNQEIEQIEQKRKKLKKQIEELLLGSAPQLIAARNRLESLSHNFDIRRYAARSSTDGQDDSYVLCGWMAEKDVYRLLKEIERDRYITIVVENDPASHFGTPPTKLKNLPLFRPYEMYVKMYGLPSHDEVDPTVFVALTYSFLFGAMFGDVGHGLLLLIGGGLLYKFKRIPLAGIISMAGFFSTIFGFLFGSIFGFEDILPAIWLRPISHMTTLPFIGKLNTVFIVAIALGMGIILFTMILHIINALRSKNLQETWFDVNGVAGLVFYGSVVAVVVLFMTGRTLPGAAVLAVMFGVPLLLVLFKEPLTKKLQKRTEKMEEGPVMFFVQGFFELFETILSYFSNTLSFVRVGAFAVSHAAMMEVVLMLANAESGNPNWIVVILGNLFVCAIEGLIVGIQVLRLEYYEMFSRFYKGTGRAFEPFTQVPAKSKTH